MPRETLCINADGTTEIKMMPTEEEMDKAMDEKYNNTLWKNKIYGNKTRVKKWTRFIGEECFFTYKVYYLDSTGIYLTMNMEEFDFTHERLGKCKYTDKELEQMRFELQE